MKKRSEVGIAQSAKQTASSTTPGLAGRACSFRVLDVLSSDTREHQPAQKHGYSFHGVQLRFSNTSDSLDQQQSFEIRIPIDLRIAERQSDPLTF